jgi:tRNA dimethylallyltransferase
LPGELGLVSVDALAVYRYMDIGTAKPTRPGEAANRHRWGLVDLVDPCEEYSVAAFQDAARMERRRLHTEGRAAVFVGGTGLYHRAVVDDLELPGSYPEIRERLVDEAQGRGGTLRLYGRLKELDPVAALRMEPGNLRRIVRALEVLDGSGRRFSEFGPGLGVYRTTDVLMVGIMMDREVRDGRLERRLESQMEEGLLEEVAGLEGRLGKPLSPTAGQAIAYRELAAHLAGQYSLDEALAETIRRLKRFSRRQEAWFRRDPRIVWLDASKDDLAGRVLALWKTAGR